MAVREWYVIEHDFMFGDWYEHEKLPPGISREKAVALLREHQARPNTSATSWRLRRSTTEIIQ